VTAVAARDVAVAIYTVAVAICSSSIRLHELFQEKLKSTPSEVETWRSWNGLRPVKESRKSRIPPAFSQTRFKPEIRKPT
jgi:hypothetical protein